MNIHVFLTVGGDRVQSGLRMLQSIDDPNVYKHVLWRDCEVPTLLNSNRYFPEKSNQMSLSMARNLLIAKALKENLIDDTDVVCFADDDGLWPENLSFSIKEVFSSDIPWVIGIYFPRDGKPDLKRFPPIREEDLSLETILMRASSLGLYVRGAILKEVGKFNELLGVGSLIESGEDTEYAIRLSLLTKRSIYDSRLFQYHAYGSELKVKRQHSSLLFLWYLYFNYHIPLLNPARRTLSLYLRRKVKLKILKVVYQIYRISRINKNMTWR